MRLNKLPEMRMCLYLLTHAYNQLPFVGATNARRDISAQLFLLCDRELKKREADIIKIDQHNIQINHLIRKEREKLTAFNATFEDAINELVNFSQVQESTQVIASSTSNTRASRIGASSSKASVKA